MSCVIFGAGKIARGFIAHLLSLSDIDFVFVEKADALADLINEREQYTINILGAPEKNYVVKNAKALKFSQEKEITEAIAEADVVFDAVGGKNLQEIVPFYIKGIEKKAEKGGYLNFVTCENWKEPAKILKEGVEAGIAPEAREYLDNYVGFTESVIMRSGIEAPKELLKKDPLIVNVQNYWHLPVDAARVKGSLPDIKYMEPLTGFAGFLERKFYTYNAANGTTSFVGALLGYKVLAEAAHDERILKILDGVYQETGKALSMKHGISLEEQMAFARTSLNKLQDYTIVDSIERNARDPQRKLGKDDRLVGSARMVLSCGIRPENLCTAIACAIYYRNPEDSSAVALEKVVKEEGIDAVLEKICGIEPEGELGILIKEKIEKIKEWGWLKNE
nr:hypothetical protein [uncultured Blautia sp.]